MVARSDNPCYGIIQPVRLEDVRDGAIAWLCVPRFDSQPLFCEILDAEKGGAFTIAPEDLAESCQYYLGETGVLVTEMRGRSGLVRITDALTLHSGADLSEDVTGARRELLRMATVLEGKIRFRVEIELYGGAQFGFAGQGLEITPELQPNLQVLFCTNIPLDGLRGTVELKAGDHAHFLLRWGSHRYCGNINRAEETMRATLEAWRSWVSHIRYEGPQKMLVRRSAITLKLFQHFKTVPS